VTATVDADGAYVFDVSTLVRGDAVAVAILPTTTASRIVFATPTDDSLKVTPAAPDTPVGSATPGPTATPSFEPAAPTVAGTRETAAPAEPPAAATADVAGPSAVAPIGAVQTAESRGSVGRAYGLLGLALAAGVAWALAGRPRRVGAG
jgi:hypothetical protein